MPLLLYCVAEASAARNSGTGVASSLVACSEHSSLSIFYSENQSTESWLKSPVRISAKEFHRVQQELFRSAAIIPFRFPTILESHEKLRGHLSEHAARYRDLLHRFSNFAQMDIALTQAASPQAASSGGEYLRDRQARTHTLEQLAAEFRRKVGPLIADWRQRSTSNGLRCFALVERKRVEEFNERMKTASVSPGVGARVSGPWPVAAFLDSKS